MTSLLIKWFVNSLAIFIVGNFFPGIHVPNYITALWAAFLLALLNVTIRPVLRLLSLPITIITLGLFAFIINGFTFWLASKFISGFTVDTFWWAVLGAFVVSLISTVLNRLVLGSDGKISSEKSNVIDI